MNLLEAAKQALGALESVSVEYDFHGNPVDEDSKLINPAITALRKAIEQAEKQEPLVWIKEREVVYIEGLKQNTGMVEWRTNLGLKPESGDVPLYTAPPQPRKKELVQLTNRTWEWRDSNEH